MKILPSPTPQSIKISNEYVWLPTLYTLPVRIACDVTCGSQSDEFLPCFSLTRAEWGNPACDALSWYLSPHRSDFTFRTKLFGQFPTVKLAGPAFQPIVGQKFTMVCEIHATHATYSIRAASVPYYANLSPYATATYADGDVPKSGYFGFAKYSDENITVENITVESIPTAKRSFFIHPGIGVARMGNSEDFFIGPETPGMYANWDDAAGQFKSFRDSQGRIKRQGARFRVFEYFWDASTGTWSNPKEVSVGTDVVDIQWRVHLANRKASFFVFDGQNGADDYYVKRAADKPDEQIKTDPDRTNRRNADIAPGDRAAKLEIDPGEKVISARQGGAVEVVNTNSNIPIKSLGTLKVDDKGRLIVLGGYGQTETTGEKPKYEMQEYASNDRWFDDAGDGPVKARVMLKDGTWVDANAAWVMVGPPNYAPAIGNVVTLFDTLLDVAVREQLPLGIPLKLTGTALKVNQMQTAWAANKSLKGYKPSFLEDIYPLLKRAFGARDVHVSGVANPQYHKMLTDWVKLATLDGPQAKEAKALREYIFAYMRSPVYPVSDVSKIDWKKMPRGHGDNYRSLEKFEDGELAENELPAANSLFSLTHVQYAILREWAGGNFINDWPGAEPKATTALSPTPDQLDKAAVEASVGGPFYPGIDCSWLIRAREVYSSPFRLKVPPQPASELKAPPLRIGAVDFRPGFFSQQMALPWQADFYDCQKERHEDPDGNEYYFMWWTAHRPDDVFPPHGTKQVRWTRELDKLAKDPQDPDNYYDYGRFVRMLEGWPKLKFISVRNGDHWEEEGVQTGDVFASPQHWYRGEGNPNDSAGTNNGTIAGTVKFAPGVVGQAFSFSVSGLVTAPDTPTIRPAQVTLDAFVNPTGAAGVMETIVTTEGGVGSGLTGIGFRRRSNNTFWFAVGQAGAGIAAQSTTKFVPGSWYRLTGTYDGTTASLYVNGALEATATQCPPVPINSTAGLSIGALPSGHEPFKGQIEEVQVYDRVVVPPASPPAGAGTPSVLVNNPTGTQAGPAPTSGSTVLRFDGTNNYVELPPLDFDFSKGFTIEVWARYAKLNHCSRIFDFGNGPAADNIFLANEALSVTLGIYMVRGGDRLAITTASVLEIDRWMHLAATIDAAGKATLYKDGKPCQTGPVSLPTKTLRRNSYIGRSNWSENPFFAGRMSELRLWNRARTAEEIQANQRRRLTGKEPGLVGYWPLNEGQGTVAQDKTTLGNHGKIQNCTWEQTEIPLVTEDQTQPGVSPAVPGLAHWYRGESNANDSAGTANGTIVGTVGYAPGVVGQSFSFSGNGQVKVPNDSTFQPAKVTLDAWVKPSSSGVYAGIVSTEDYGRGTTGFGFRQRTNDTFWFVVGGEGYGIAVESTTKLYPGNWYHLTGTYDGTTAKLYVNGVLEGTRAQGSPIPVNSTAGLRIGAFGPGWECFNGLVDEVQVFNQSLSARQVAALAGKAK